MDIKICSDWQRENILRLYLLSIVLFPQKWLPRAVWVSSECDWLISKEAAKYPLITHWCLPPGAHCQLGTSFGIIISSVSHHYLIIISSLSSSHQNLHHHLISISISIIISSVSVIILQSNFEISRTRFCLRQSNLFYNTDFRNTFTIIYGGTHWRVSKSCCGFSPPGGS